MKYFAQDIKIVNHREVSLPEAHIILADTLKSDFYLI